MASPVPATVPPHDPVNHCVMAPAPLNPPATVSVVLSPLHTVVLPVAPVGAIDKALTVTVTVAQVVVLQVPLYLT